MSIIRSLSYVCLLAAVLPPNVLATTIGTTQLSPASAQTGTPVTLTVTSSIPGDGVVAGSVNLQRLDALGRATSIVGTLRDDGREGDATAGDRVYTLRFTLLEQNPGPVSFRVSAAFQGTLVRALSAPVTVAVAGASTAVAITSPANLSFHSISPIIVSGTVGTLGTPVFVNSIPAVVNGQQFQVSVPLIEGTNTLTAVATHANGQATTASLTVTLDTTPPRISIDAPSAGSTTTDATVTVSGLVNDVVVGTVNDQQAAVTVNGRAATVQNRSFVATGVALNLGENTIQAVARDRSGNSATASVKLTRVTPAGPRISVVSGAGQSGMAGAALPAPLVVSLVNGSGQPLASRDVVFKVTQNDGTVQAGSAGGSSVVAKTNAQGRAEARWTLGGRAGAGNNVVEATAPGIPGSALFVATGTPTAAAKINVDSGMNQTGAIGQPLGFPFVAVVTDARHNRLPNVRVTFTVRRGGGLVGGGTTLSTNTDGDGRALAVLTLGPEEGNDNNVVEANFAGNTGRPAAFTASARRPGPAAQTTISGVVLDNSNRPIPGVTIRMFRPNQGSNNAQPMQIGTPVQTNAAGQFQVAEAPVGFIKLMADGSTASPVGTWPTLEYDLVTISGRDNTVGMPIYLPRLDTATRLCVTPTTGGVLRLPKTPGFALEVAPGSATFPGGSRTGCISVTPVNGDKVPMVPGFGQQPRFVVTIQPVGTQFNPPARITIPNVDGLAPRAKTEMYSFDHDLASFVSIGAGTVSEDGGTIASDPGVGVIKAGWHCGGNPNPVGTAATCPQCQRCDGTGCSPGPDNASCDDGDPSTFEDVCTRGTCRGRGAGTSIRSIWSNQWPRNRSNRAPGSTGRRENIVLLAVDASNTASVEVEFTTVPFTEQVRGSALVQLVRAGTEEPVLATRSERRLSEHAPNHLIQRIDFVYMESDFGKFEAVSGLDADGNGRLTGSEISSRAPWQFWVVSRQRFNVGLATALAGGTFVRYPFAAALLRTFATNGNWAHGATRVGTQAIRTTDATLSHAVGAEFDTTGLASVPLYEYGPESDPSLAARNAAEFTQSVRRTVFASSAAIKKYFADNPTIDFMRFDPVDIVSPTGDGLISFDSDQNLFLAIGTASLRGQLAFDVRKLADGRLKVVSVRALNVRVFDLYDWDAVSFGIDAEMAAVQAGYNVLAPGAGQIFWAQILIDGVLGQFEELYVD